MKLSTDQVDYLAVTLEQAQHGWDRELYGKKDAMPGQVGRQRAPHIGTELSAQCKYGVIPSQMPPFQPGDSVVAPTVLQGHRVASSHHLTLL